MDKSSLKPGNLRRIKSLAVLSDEQLAAFINYVDVVSVPRGTTLFQEKQPGDSLYMILEGEMRIFIEQRGGQIILLRLLEAGDTFGEVALLNQAPRSASVEAKTDCTLIQVTSQMLEKLMGEQPAAAAPFLFHLAKTLGRELTDLTTKLRKFREQADLLSSL
jgi:CRP/FNR family transcriptional regulator/CRP/FNR family cyclic AMP-dependent transcriptional regulator